MKMAAGNTTKSLHITSNCHYDVFISHSSRFIPAQLELISVLEGAFERCGIKIFLDRSSFNSGDLILPGIQRAIKNSFIGLLILSERAISRGWVQLELEEMRRQSLAGHMQMMALRLKPDCDVPKGIKRDDIIDPPYPNDFGHIACLVEKEIKKRLPQ